MIGLLLALLLAAAVFLLVMRILDRRMRNLAAYERWVAEQARVPREPDFGHVRGPDVGVEEGRDV